MAMATAVWPRPTNKEIRTRPAQDQPKPAKANLWCVMAVIILVDMAMATAIDLAMNMASQPKGMANHGPPKLGLNLKRCLHLSSCACVTSLPQGPSSEPIHLYDLLSALDLADELHLCGPLLALEPPD